MISFWADIYYKICPFNFAIHIKSTLGVKVKFRYNTFMKQAQAHSEEENSGITAVMHIGPTDHLTLGNKNSFFFEFNNATQKFSIQQCDCAITVLKDGKEFDKQAVLETSNPLGSLDSEPLYEKTFSDAGNYKLQLSGSPKDGAMFEPFVLSYDLSTETGSHDSTISHLSMSPSQHIGHILIFGGGFVAAVVLLIRNHFQNRKVKNEQVAQKDN